MKKAYDNGEDYLMNVTDKCIICDKGSYGQIMLIKVPEGVLFCIECSKKHQDNKVYKGIEGYRGVYQIGEGVL